MYLKHWLLMAVLFNNALNTFCLQLYGIRHIVRDHSDSQKRKPLPLLHFQMFGYKTFTDDNDL